MELKNFNEVIEYLNSFSYVDKSKSPGYLRPIRLERMKSLLKHFNNPENSFKAIHIAGSKGKGSLATLLAKAISSLGFKCGLYTSPHVIDYRERFSLSGIFFSDEILISVANKLKKGLDNFNFSSEMENIKPSTFELYTLYAYLLFKYANCTYAVIETGLGGRLDATNTLYSIASVIMPIEIEHTDILGNTLGEIAIEKSKIIKHNQICFASFLKDEVLKIIKKEALEQNTTLVSIKDEIIKLKAYDKLDGQNVELEYSDNTSYNLNLKLQTRVQSENVALAILILKKLNLFEEEKTIKALEETQIIGRFQSLNIGDKSIVLDVAHTKNSIFSTVNTFKSLYKEGIVIFGSLENKDIKSMLEIILSNFSTLIISKPGSFKKSNVEDIYNQARTINKNANIYLHKEAKDALGKAFELSNKILIVGSFYLLDEVLGVLNGIKQ